MNQTASLRISSFSFWMVAGLLVSGIVYAQSPSAKIQVKADGAVMVPAEMVPLSSNLSAAARQYVTEHLEQMQDPEIVKQDAGVPRFMKPYLAWDRQRFAVDRKEMKIGGVHVYVYTPRGGVKAENHGRVLVNLHGGGFTGCWPGCAELESIPLAAQMGVKVVSVDYREGPKDRFPAASEDVARVYRELLKQYAAKSIGVYGCSAGGMLTAMSLAWFETHGLPMPGADGIFCASAGGFGGDAQYIAFPLGEARMPPAAVPGARQLGYFAGANPDDPMVAPIRSASTLAKFPPTLLITGTRDFAMSGAIETELALHKAGVATELHVWDGLFHGFFYNAEVPESQDAFAVMAEFFSRRLERSTR